VRFKPAQNFPGTRDHEIRQACKFRDLAPVGAIGCPRPDPVQHDHPVAVFADIHRDVGDAGEAFRECRHLVIVRRKQRAALNRIVQMLNGRPGN